MDGLIILLLILFVMILILRKIHKSSSETGYVPDKNYVPYTSSSSSENTENKTYESPHHDINKVSVIKFKVAGLYYRPYYNQHRAARLKINEPLKLEAEPDNEFDPNAIKVMTSDNVELGYMPKDLAAKWVTYLDKLNECHLISNFPDGDINRLEVAAVFDCITPTTYDFVVDDYYVSSQYEDKFPELKDIYLKSEEDLNQTLLKINTYLETYKSDFYLRYSYAKVLRMLKRYDEALSYIDEIIQFLPESKNSKCIRNERKFIKERIKEIKERELKEQMDFKMGQAKVLMQNKKYDEALPLLMFCYKNNLCQQQLINDICRCYKNMKDKEGLVKFANGALKKDWISPKTKGMLTSIKSL